MVSYAEPALRYFRTHFKSTQFYFKDKDINLKEDRGHAMNQILEWKNLFTPQFFLTIVCYTQIAWWHYH